MSTDAPIARPLDVQSFELVFEERPWSLNIERTEHWSKRAGDVKRWREAFGVLALEAKLPKRLPAITVSAIPTYKRGPLPDTGACFGAVKAAIDGLVDAGVIENDTPQIVRSITMDAPAFGARDSLRLRISGVMREKRVDE